MAEITLVEAVNLALSRAMQEDPNVVVLGEDVGVNGGVFRATVGLQQRFGRERVPSDWSAQPLPDLRCIFNGGFRAGLVHAHTVWNSFVLAARL